MANQGQYTISDSGSKKSIRNTCPHGGIYSVDPSLVKVDFSSNVNPLGISTLARETIRRNALSLSSMYPDTDCRTLRESLSVYLENDLDHEWICLGNGATELIHRFAQTFVRGKVLIPFPTFCEYEIASERVGANVVFVPLNTLRLDPGTIIEEAKNSDAIFLCNPNNPTGETCNSKLIERIVESVDNSTKILVDESYIELSNTPDMNTMINKIKEFENLLILRSMTKSFALAGLRIGYMICNPKLIKRLSNNQISWTVNGIAQAAGIASLKDLDHLKRSRILIQKERRFMHETIKKRIKTFIPYTSDVNYFLIYLENKSSKKLRNLILAHHGVLVRDCSTFMGMGEKYFRVAVKTHKENVCLLDALESFDN